MKKILIFDDEEAIRMLYEIELSEEGYEVISSGDVSRCFELILEHSPNVVVMDKKMGNHDGLAVLRKMRARFPAIPLVLCTAYPCQGQDEALDVVDFYVTKSFDMRDMKEKIKSAFGLPG